MTVARTTLLDLPIITTGTESGLWGDYTNNGLTQYLDISIAGMSNLTSANFTAGALTIETTEGTNSATNIVATSAQYAGFRVSSLATNSTITVGNTGTTLGRSYRLINADSTYTLTFKATGQTGVTLQPGQSAVVAFNGTDYALVGTIGPTVPVARGGTGATTLTANNVILGNGTSAVQFVAPGTNGNVLTSNGTTWTSAAGASLNTPLAVIGNATAGAEIRLPEDTDNGSNYVALKAADSLAANVTFTLPNADGSNGQLIQTNGSGTLSFVTGAVAANLQEFTSSGTWTKPTGATFVMVECWGAGGGGASGWRYDTSFGPQGGGGGGGGAYTVRLFPASALSSTVSVTVGAGGTGAASITTNNTSGSDGTAGGNTTFGSYLISYGGAKGNGYTGRGGLGGGALNSGYDGGYPRSGSDGQFGSANSGGSSSYRASGHGGGTGGYGDTGPATGGCSYQGGPGGGGGGYLYSGTTGVASSGGDGGTITGSAGGGAAGGAAPSPATTGNGNNGANGSSTAREGAGGGSSGGDTSGTGGNGGTGGIASGGGGGGASRNGSNSGAGGNGGPGLVRVYTW